MLMHEMTTEEYLERRREFKKKWQEENAAKQAEKDKKQEQMAKEDYIYTDKVDTMENSTATVLYIIVMVGGAIFKDRIGIWILASIIYFTHIFRYQIREQKWESKGKAEWEKRYYGGAK